MGLSLVAEPTNVEPSEAQRRAYVQMPPIPHKDQSRESIYTHELWRVAMTFTCPECLVPEGRRCLSMVRRHIHEGTPYEIKNPHHARRTLAWAVEPALIRTGKLPENNGAQPKRPKPERPKRPERSPEPAPEPPLRPRVERVWDIAVEVGCPYCHMPPGQRCMERSSQTGYFHPIALPHADRVL